MDTIYLDNASTTFPKPACVPEAMLRYITGCGSNIARGGYSAAYSAEEMVFETRERICALSRYLMVDVLNPAMTAGTQWFERTLDDSANKRIAMAEGFLAADAILNILLNVSDGLVVYPKVVRARVMAELPFMASENIMMKAVKKGGDRQELHERLREHAVAAAAVVKQEGKPNDMIARVEADPAFGLTREEIEAELSPEAFTGRSAEQVTEFLRDVIQPVLDANKEDLGQHVELNV